MIRDNSPLWEWEQEEAFVVWITGVGVDCLLFISRLHTLHPGYIIEVSSQVHCKCTSDVLSAEQGQSGLPANRTTKPECYTAVFTQRPKLTLTFVLVCLPSAMHHFPSRPAVYRSIPHTMHSLCDCSGFATTAATLTLEIHERNTNQDWDITSAKIYCWHFLQNTHFMYRWLDFL